MLLGQRYPMDTSTRVYVSTYELLAALRKPGSSTFDPKKTRFLGLWGGD